MTNLKENDDVLITSIRLHNENAFRYFQQLKFPKDEGELAKFLSQFIQDDLKIKDENKRFYEEMRYVFLMQKISTITPESQYNPNEKYNKLFSEFFEALDKFQDKILENYDSKSIYNDNFILSLYDNQNKNLDETYKAIKRNTQSHTTDEKTSVQKKISSGWNKDKEESKTNAQLQHPQKADEWRSKVSAVASPNFTPQRNTNIPHLFNYNVKVNGKKITQHRFGTQAKVENNNYGIAGSFKLFMKSKENTEKKHLYFNCLGLDRPAYSKFDPRSYEGHREYSFTQALHNYSNEQKNLFVVTLPSDKGLMTEHDFDNRNEKEGSPAGAFYGKIMTLVTEQRSDINNSNSQMISDLYISPDVMTLLIADQKEMFEQTKGHESLSEEKKLNIEDYNQCSDQGKKQKILERAFFVDLLDKSFSALGVKPSDIKSMLTKSQQQAIYIHFIKYELTNKIIEAIQPDSMNFSCKDAIDRGGLASAYFNLIHSFEHGEPISFEDFDKAVNGPPSMVKARGMNTHIERLWNAIDYYVDTNHDKIINNPEQIWLIEWRDRNCPPILASDLLDRKIEQCTKDPNNIDQIVQEIKSARESSKSDDRTLLALLTVNLAISQKDVSDDVINRCEASLEKISSNTTNYTNFEDIISSIESKLEKLDSNYELERDAIYSDEDDDLKKDLEEFIGPPLK